MITKTQKKILDFVKDYSQDKGYAPSLDEIRKRFKYSSVSTPHHHIKKLQTLGYLDKEQNHPRAIKIFPDEAIESPFVKDMKMDSVSLPIVGSANCGPADLFAEENIDGFLKVAPALFGKKDGIFVIRAEGDSMNRANIDGRGINDGDFVLIDSSNRTPEDGDYVLSVIDGMANIKKFTQDKKSGHIMLVSESTNKKHKPIYISSEDDFMINGKVTAVIKK